MSEHADENAAIWQSEGGVAGWLAGAEDRERQRAEPRRLMADLLPFGAEDAFVLVDLGAGTGAAARAVLDRYPGASAVLAEFSPQMVEAGTRALEPYRGRYRYVDFDLTNGPWPADIPEKVDVAVSSMCLHHLPDARKEQLCAEVFARLQPGGWFLDLDVVTAGDPVVAEAWERAEDRQDPEGAPTRRHRTAEEQHRYENHIRHISPLPRRLGYLGTAGFEGVDVFWRRLELVLMGGRRPA